MTGERPYATVKDASELLEVSPETVRHWEARGVLPRAMRHPVSRYRLWPREQLEEACRRLQPRVPEEAPAA